MLDKGIIDEIISFSFPLGVVRENGSKGKNAHIHCFSFPLGVVSKSKTVLPTATREFQFPIRGSKNEHNSEARNPELFQFPIRGSKMNNRYKPDDQLLKFQFPIRGSKLSKEPFMPVVIAFQFPIRGSKSF